MAELAGAIVGNYFLLERLQREGIVETYRARPTTRGGYDVVLRIFRPTFPDVAAFRSSFAEEVEKLWCCRHPHIQPLIEYGTGQELLYSVTPLSGLETLEQFLARQPGPYLPLSLVLRLVTQLAGALSYAHARGIVHGNIQPDSILISNEELCLLSNFSLRRAYEPGTLVEALCDEGNSLYRAPEQSLGMLSPASDLYSLGVLLYRLLCGCLPFEGVDADEVILRHATEVPVPLRNLRPELSERLEQVVACALRKHPEERFQDAEAFARALLLSVTPANSDLATEPELPLVAESKLAVPSNRPNLTWSRAASLLTLGLLVFGLLSSVWFVFSLPQIRAGKVPFLSGGWLVKPPVQKSTTRGAPPVSPPPQATSSPTAQAYSPGATGTVGPGSSSSPGGRLKGPTPGCGQGESKIHHQARGKCRSQSCKPVESSIPGVCAGWAG